MKGQILGFEPDSNTGAISGHDGQRYDFVTLDWRGSGRPMRGDTVDFVADGTRARQIYSLGQRFSPGEAANANTVYILYLVGLAVGVTSIVGLIIAYVNRADAPEWVRTHYRFQIRTFWIGVLYGLIGALTCIIVVGFFFLVFVLVWWIVRCVKGMQAISRGVPYDQPATWLW
ncbi:MAG TPA: DUF4870 domain-containing protein [Stellaceae bacterium]|nr:DUF4870 domain-containing protein [Stellaceae bacterium]